MGNSATATCLKYLPILEPYNETMSANDPSSGTSIVLPPEGVKNIPNTSTALMGTISVSATRPKLSSSDVLSPRIDASPSPRALTKGTRMGPYYYRTQGDGENPVKPGK